ncbi:hypothetical protein [Sphingobacterium sp. 1.A.5]|uniref:hypothetical protein n=1 Tax=Sphingobacterium sp. 1.A.5 TaxID=2044604 RepID=UPI0011817BBC|nr:hypothetical protein [Sphingobacterium sp. 1.A.5]
MKKDISLADHIIECLKTKEVFNNFDTHFVSGKNQRPAREKLILVNTLFAMQDDDTKEIEGYININIQDSDTVWIEYIGELIQLYVDQSIIAGYKLDFTTEHLFKVSQDLFFKNLKFHFSSL